MLFEKKHNEKTYPLLPFSQLVYDLTRWMPRLYLFSYTFVMRGKADKKDKMKAALRQALYAHSVFQMRINRHGRQYQAERRNILHGKYHDFTLWTKGEDLYLRCSLNRILGDGKSMLIFAEDVCKAFMGEKIDSDNYWDYIECWEKQKEDAHYLSSKTWLEHQFADTSIPVRPTIDRSCLTTVLPPKAGVLILDLTEYKSSVKLLSEREHLSLDGLFSLCVALAISDYCGTGSAALTWAYEGRETPREERIFGSLHRDVPFVITRDDDIKALIRQARNQIRSGIAHSDYPYTLSAPYAKRWNYAVNVLHNELPEIMVRHLPLEFEILPQRPRRTAYALLDIEITDYDNYLGLTLRYSATHYKQQSVQRFAEMIKNNLLILINCEQD